MDRSKELIIYYLLMGDSINLARSKSGFGHTQFTNLRLKDKQFNRAVSTLTEEARRLNYEKQKFK
mgnify:FL=1|jgi:hypothetical protein